MSNIDPAGFDGLLLAAFIVAAFGASIVMSVDGKGILRSVRAWFGRAAWWHAPGIAAYSVRRWPNTCWCAAYRWPHRRRMGRCSVGREARNG